MSSVVLATAGYDHSIRFWEVSAPAAAQPFGLRRLAASSAAPSPPFAWLHPIQSWSPPRPPSGAAPTSTAPCCSTKHSPGGPLARSCSARPRPARAPQPAPGHARPPQPCLQATSGICYRTLQYPDSQINKLEITYDKQFIAAAGNPHIKLFEVQPPPPPLPPPASQRHAHMQRVQQQQQQPPQVVSPAAAARLMPAPWRPRPPRPAGQLQRPAARVQL